MSNVAAHFQRKNKMFIYLSKYTNEESQESGKYLKNDATETYLEPCKMSIMECFFNVDLEEDIPT